MDDLFYWAGALVVGLALIALLFLVLTYCLQCAVAFSKLVKQPRAGRHYVNTESALVRRGDAIEVVVEGKIHRVDLRGLRLFRSWGFYCVSFKTYDNPTDSEILAVFRMCPSCFTPKHKELDYGYVHGADGQRKRSATGEFERKAYCSDCRARPDEEKTTL